MPIRTLVADDSFLFRRVITQALSSIPGAEVVGSVSSGASVLEKVRELSPDLLTLDMEMPGMSGLEVLDALRESKLKVMVLVISAVTLQGGKLTLQALEKGAFDFITKPSGSSAEANQDSIRQELTPRLRALAHRLEVRNILRGQGAEPAPRVQPEKSLQTAVQAGAPLDDTTNRMIRLATSAKPEMVLIGVSTGGPNALKRIFAALPANLGVPILVVQHMPPIFTKLLAEDLTANSAIEVREAVHGEAVAPNKAYIAPGGKQMRLIAGPCAAKLIELTDDPPENNCKPSVDYFFRSVSNHFPGRSAAVILTGMGDDGTLGLRLLKRRGCTVIAQDEASCVVFGMPKAAIDAGVVDMVLPLDSIAARISSVVHGALA